ncbi:unnamed protein product [Haemonchus placei]|uniref:Uncharacterized protein n=1 Tax=Haemonchus placei TaxID=6290 RepID=A0A0N4X3Z5_HAEPC|nr:unnamed protein product [Haemonchus placei]
MDLSDVSAMFDQTDNASSPSNALEHVVGRLHSLEAAVNELLKRSEPQSSHIFCPVADNRDGHGHNTLRRDRFPDAVAKSMQVARLGLCDRCLKPAHDGDDCGVQCAACGGPHNVLLCANRGQGGRGFKRRRP